MKKTFTLFSALLIGILNHAQQPIFTQATLESARVYYNGAELTQKAILNLPKGNSEIVITNVANTLNENTIQVGSTNEVTVMSVQFSNDYIEEYDNNHNSPLSKPLRDSIEILELKLEKLKNSINSDNETISLLDDKANSNENENSLRVREMIRLVNYYKSKRQELLNSIYLEKKELEKTEIAWNNLKAKLKFGENNSEKVSNGKLIIQVMNNSSAGNVPFHINYLTQQAQWVPFYDLRIDKINQPIKMMYKAQIVQTSGIDWKNVKLNLTSGLINQSNTIPVWNTWFINYEPLAIESDVVIQGVKIDKRSYSGSITTTSTSNIQRKPNNPHVDYNERKSIAEYTTVNVSQLNVTFDIDIPYTILNNGKRHSVNLKDFNLPATYKYYTAPKLDLNAYLVATIKEYANYNLLPGDANVIFDGLHVGKTYLSTENTEETLKLNLGKDSKISLNRTLITDKSDIQVQSSRRTQQYVYEITIRNNKKEEADVQVEDQIPISSDTDLIIETLETQGGELDAEKGIISWNLKLKPNETKKIRVSYQVKSNKDRRILGM